jgi:predicted esterase
VALVALAWLAPSAQAIPVNPVFGVRCVDTGLAGTPFDAGTNCRTVRVQRYPRRYIVWVPPSAQDKIDRGERVPMVIMLHGSSGTGSQFFKHSGWQEKATEEGFVAVFPTGLKYQVIDANPVAINKWNSYNLPGIIDPSVKPPGSPARADWWPANDVRFVRLIIADVRTGLPIKRKRVYLAGFSNGGEMCGRIGVELSDLVAAVGCNAGGLDAVRPTIGGHRNIDMMITVGSLDENILALIQQADPTITEIPLDPRALATTPVLSESIRTTSRRSAWRRPRSPSSAASRPSQNCAGARRSRAMTTPTSSSSPCSRGSCTSSPTRTTRPRTARGTQTRS